MNRLEILKAFLQDAEIMQKYGIKQKELDDLTLSTSSPNLFITLVQQFVGLVEEEKRTETTIVSNLNQFLEQKLRNS